MEKRLYSFCTLICIFFFCACAPETSVAPDTLRLQLAAEPSTLNPIFATDAYGMQIAGYLFDNLIELDNDTLQYKAKLATSWEVSTDHKTYTFHLRRDARWQDGVPVTADDVIYTFGLLKDPKIDAPNLKSYYKDVVSAEKLNETTIQFKYATVYYRGLTMCGGIPILPKHILEKAPDIEHSDFARRPIGNGPFIFQKWDTNKKIVLVRNENYWGKKPEIRTIEYKIIPDASAGLQILKKGLLDEFSPRAISWVKQLDSEKFNAQFSKFSYPGRNFTYIAWNTNSPFFSDKRVRQAMTMLTDIEKIKNKILFGLARTITGPFFPFGPQSNNQIKPLPYDPAAAKVLLAEAGWRDSDGDGWLDKDGRKFSFTFLYSSGSTFVERLATILKENLMRVGIEVKIDRMEWTVFLERIHKKDFDATSLGWSLPLENDPYQIYHSSQADVPGSSNYISYKNPDADKLLEAARVEFDEKKRNALYWQFQEVLYDDQPYTFLYSVPNLEVVSKRFKNVVVHPAGLNTLEWQVTQ